MDAGQLQPKRDPDIARSDCLVPHLGQRCRVQRVVRLGETDHLFEPGLEGDLVALFLLQLGDVVVEEIEDLIVVV